MTLRLAAPGAPTNRLRESDARESCPAASDEAPTTARVLLIDDETLLLRAITKVLGWRLRGRAWPHPFFHLKTREPIYPLKVLTAEQREALRPLCGPKPALRMTT